MNKALSCGLVLIASFTLLTGCTTQKTSAPAKVKVEQSSKKKAKTKSSKTQSTTTQSSTTTSSEQPKEQAPQVIDVNAVNDALKQLHQFTYASGEKFDKVLQTLQQMRINVSINTRSYYNKYEFSGRGDNGVILSSIITKENISDSGQTVQFDYDFRYAISPTTSSMTLDTIGKNVQTQLKEDKYANITKHVSYRLTLSADKTSCELSILNTDWM